jgi:hypothetical protein
MFETGVSPLEISEKSFDHPRAVMYNALVAHTLLGILIFVNLPENPSDYLANL